MKVSTRVLSMAAGAGISLAGIAHDAMAQRAIDSTGKIADYSKKGTITDAAASAYTIAARATDTNDPNIFSIKDRSGNYRDGTRGRGSNLTDPATSTGRIFSATARTQINFAPLRNNADRLVGWTWDSGTQTKAEVSKVPNAPNNVEEFAAADAKVIDPREFVLDPDETVATFGITFAAGTHLSVQDSGSDGFSRSWIAGFEHLSILDPYSAPGTGSLFNFNWSLDSISPAETQFVFTSNPVLGLDDAMITSMFMANISGADGDFSLLSDFTIECDVTGLAPGQIFEFGGETDYHAEAGIGVPAPGSAALLGLAGLALTRHRKAPANG